MSVANGFVIPAGGGKHFDSPTPGRSFALKLLGRETDESIMMFEETLPPGTASLYHLHHESDEVAWVLAGEFTFKIGDDVTVGGPGTCAFMPRNIPHAWKNTGSETGRVLFLYTPAAAGGLIEALSERRPVNDEEHTKLFERHAGKSSAQTRFEGARGRSSAPYSRAPRPCYPTPLAINRQRWRAIYSYSPQQYGIAVVLLRQPEAQASLALAGHYGPLRSGWLLGNPRCCADRLSYRRY